MNRNEDFKADLLAELKADSAYAAEYLSAAKADSNEAFLVALRDVAEARKGMRRVAKDAKVNRERPVSRAFEERESERLDALRGAGRAGDRCEVCRPGCGSRVAPG